MKKKNKIKNELNKTSFQTQLFLIVLLSFILLVVFDYIIISYAFKNRYIKTKIDDCASSVSSLVHDINNRDNLSGSFESFNVSTNSIPLFVDSSGGGFLLTDSLYSSYQILVEYNNDEYLIEIKSENIEIEAGDIIKSYIQKSASSDSYIAKTLKINDKNIIDDKYENSFIFIDDGVVKEIYKPSNLNYLYDNNSVVNIVLDLLNSKSNDFSPNNIGGSSYSSYYLDNENGYLYFLVKPNKYSNSSYFVLTISSIVETDSLISIVSSYYGYIVLGSVVVSVLIALFISRAFSNPVKTIEKEIKKLADSDYKTSSYEFNNRELISLQDTINDVKIDTSEKVQNIENQRESLEKLNKELLKESELRSSFIARLSHELKTPLMVISATTEALASGLINESDKDKEYETILSEVDKTTGIIKDIISTYKTSSKEAKLKIERFSLNELVLEILSSLLPLSEKRNLIIEKNLSIEAFIDADKTLLSQVISNFITNAFKYTKENNKVEINIIDSKNSYTFEVKNHGSHIEEENLEKIWLPFFRENENIDSTSTGMGLYIVKEILTTHGFEYGVENNGDSVSSFFTVKK